MLPYLINKFLIFLVSFTVVLEPGSGDQEKDLAMDITSKLKENLNRKGINVVMVKHGDGSSSQVDIANTVNQSKGDIFISLHFNACISNQASGFEIFYNHSAEGFNKVPLNWELVQSKYYKNSKALANMVLFGLENEFNEKIDVNLNMINRATTEANLLPLKGIAMPAVLVELGFLTNELEAIKIKDPIWQDKTVNALSKVILNYRQKYEK